VTDNTTVFLTRTRQEARAVDKGDDRQIEGVTNADVAGDFVTRIDVERTGHIAGLVSNNADRVAIHTCKTNDSVLRVGRLDFHEAVTVEDGINHVTNVVRAIRTIGNDAVERFFHAADRIFGNNARRLFVVILRQIAEQLLDKVKAIFFRFRGQMRHAAGAHVHARAAQVINRNLLARHGLDNFRPGQEHIALAGHDDEIGQSRRIHCAACARTKNDGNLRDDAGRFDVTHEHFAVSSQAAHAFLNTGAARVTQADAGNTGFQRLVHDAGNFLRLHFGERAAQHREILCINGNATTVDLTETGDNGITDETLFIETKCSQVMRRHHTDFLERPFVEQKIDPLARRQFAACVLRVDTLLTTAQHCAFAFFTQSIQKFLCHSIHRQNSIRLNNLTF